MVEKYLWAWANAPWGIKSPLFGYNVLSDLDKVIA